MESSSDSWLLLTTSESDPAVIHPRVPPSYNGGFLPPHRLQRATLLKRRRRLLLLLLHLLPHVAAIMVAAAPTAPLCAKRKSELPTIHMKEKSPYTCGISLSGRETNTEAWPISQPSHQSAVHRYSPSQGFFKGLPSQQRHTHTHTSPF